MKIYLLEPYKGVTEENWRSNWTQEFDLFCLARADSLFIETHGIFTLFMVTLGMFQRQALALQMKFFMNVEGHELVWLW